MTLKQALKARKSSVQHKCKTNVGYWMVTLDLELVEKVSVTEYVKADSEAEANAQALVQFEKRSPKIIHDRATRPWSTDNTYSHQNLRIVATKSRKRITLTPAQKELLQELRTGKYLQRECQRWQLVNPLIKTNWGSLKSGAKSAVCVDSLFQKGLLIDINYLNMSEQEITIQDALGSLPEKLKEAYTIDERTVTQLGLKL